MDPQSIQLVTEGAATTGRDDTNADEGGGEVKNAGKGEADASLQ